MSDEKSDKLAKLRNRVQEKLVGSRLKSRRLKKDTEEDIVIKVEKTEEPEIKELPLSWMKLKIVEVLHPLLF